MIMDLDTYLGLPLLETIISEKKISTEVYRTPKIGKLYRLSKIKPSNNQIVELRKIIAIEFDYSALDKSKYRFAEIKELHVTNIKVEIVYN